MTAIPVLTIVHEVRLDAGTLAAIRGMFLPAPVQAEAAAIPQPPPAPAPEPVILPEPSLDLQVSMLIDTHGLDKVEEIFTDLFAGKAKGGRQEVAPFGIREESIGIEAGLTRLLRTFGAHAVETAAVRLIAEGGYQNHLPPVPPDAAPDLLPETPPPPAPPALPHPTLAYWSPERDALLKEQYPAGVLMKAIKAALHELPGQPLTSQVINTRVNGFKLRRPPGFTLSGMQEPVADDPTSPTDAAPPPLRPRGRPPAPTLPPVAAEAPDPPPAAPGVPKMDSVAMAHRERVIAQRSPPAIPRTRAQIVQWAALSKCPHGDPFDLAKINAFRASNRLPPYEKIAEGWSGGWGPDQLAYSPAQIRTIREMVAGDSRPEGIHEALHRQPGARPTLEEVVEKIIHMRKLGEIPLPPVIREEDRDREPRGLKPVTATHTFILKWAQNRGLCLDGNLDLDLVNAKAAELKLPPFILHARAESD